MHNNAVRALNAEVMGLNPEKRTMLPKVAFTSFTARYREPKVEEGFQDIVRVDFEVRTFLLTLLGVMRPPGLGEGAKDWLCA